MKELCSKGELLDVKTIDVGLRVQKTEKAEFFEKWQKEKLKLCIASTCLGT